MKKKKTAPEIGGLHHVFIPTRDFEKTWKFWTETAGAEAVASWGGGDGHRAGNAKLGGVDIVISQEREAAEQYELAYPVEYGRPVLFFKTPNVDKLYRALANGGAPILRGPLVTHWGKKAVSVKAGEMILAFVEDKKTKKRK